MSVAVGLIAAIERAVRVVRDGLEVASTITTDGVTTSEQCGFGVAVIADALFLINSETSHHSGSELGRDERWRDAGQWQRVAWVDAGITPSLRAMTLDALAV